MKILVISLLRVGDLFQQRPLLQRLRELYPNAQIEVLTNLSCLSARELFPEVNEWRAFDREKFQKAVGTAEIPLLAPVIELETWLASWTGQPYDLLLNFTHNKLSAQLAAMIAAKEKRGLLAEERGFRSFENSWLRHFNERFGMRKGTPFHYAEVLAASFGLSLPTPPSPQAQGTTIFIQALTSDTKKNWHLSSWKKLVDQLRVQRPDFSVKILGAPFEKEKLLSVFEEEDLAILGWTDLQKSLKTAALLISGDTSVKHLAASLNVPILELALGSADPARTGVYSQGDVILHASVDCAPCVHSQPCRKMSHLCGESLPVRDVLKTALQILSGDELSLPEGKEITLYRTEDVPVAGWMLLPGGQWTTDLAAEAVDQATWKLSLDAEKIPETGSSAWALRYYVHSEALTILCAEQVELETRLQAAEASLKNIGRQLLAGQHDAGLFQQVRREFNTVTSLSSRVRRHLLDLIEVGIEPFPSPLHFYGALKKRIEELKVRTDLRGKLIEQLLQGEKDHGKTVGELSISGPEASGESL